MVRKWSYINQSITAIDNFYINYKSLKNRFKYKVFRKNTRFKKSSISYTKFIRRKQALIKRKSNLQLYFLIPNSFLQFLLKIKKLINFTQLKLVHTYPITFSYDFINLKIEYNLVSNTRIAVNISTLEKKIHTLSQVFVKKNTNFGINRTVYFNKLNNINKLTNSGFIPCKISFSHKLSTSTFVNLNYKSYDVIYFYQKPILLSLLSLRNLTKYLVIFSIKL